jgi:hypothetical protein
MSMDSTSLSRHHLANWIKKEDITIYCLQETHLTDRNKHWIRVKIGRRFNKTMAPENRQA